MAEVTHLNEFQHRRFHVGDGNLWEDHQPRFGLVPRAVVNRQCAHFLARLQRSHRWMAVPHRLLLADREDNGAV